VAFAVILVVCRDIWPSPWFCVTAVKVNAVCVAYFRHF